MEDRNKSFFTTTDLSLPNYLQLQLIIKSDLSLFTIEWQSLGFFRIVNLSLVHGDGMSLCSPE